MRKFLLKQTGNKVILLILAIVVTFFMASRYVVIPVDTLSKSTVLNSFTNRAQFSSLLSWTYSPHKRSVLTRNLLSASAAISGRKKFELCQKASEVTDKDIDVSVCLCQVHLDLEEYQQAISHCQQALEISRNNQDQVLISQTQTNLGLVYLHQKKDNLARKNLTHALETDKLNQTAWLSLARLSYWQDNCQDVNYL